MQVTSIPRSRRRCRGVMGAGAGRPVRGTAKNGPSANSGMPNAHSHPPMTPISP